MDRILKNNRYRRYSAYNPVLGSGIVMGILAAYNQNAALFTVVNPLASAYWHIAEFLWLRVAAADVGSTDVQVDIRHDPTVRTGAPAGGSAITPVDHLVGKPRVSPALIQFGAVTPANADAGEQRVMARVLEADAAPAFDVGDEWRLDFDVLRPGGIFVGPRVLGKGESLLVHAFGTAMTAAPQLEMFYQFREVQDRTL